MGFGKGVATRLERRCSSDGISAPAGQVSVKSLFRLPCALGMLQQVPTAGWIVIYALSHRARFLLRFMLDDEDWRQRVSREKKRLTLRTTTGKVQQSIRSTTVSKFDPDASILLYSIRTKNPKGSVGCFVSWEQPTALMNP